MDTLREFKTRYLQQLALVPSFATCSQIWAPYIADILDGEINGSSLFNLGDRLSEIFRTTGGEGREQGSLSGGGVAWECLVCWYLNLVFWNTPVFVGRQNKNFVPEIINDSICVTISNTQTNTESDIVIFTVHDAENLHSSKLTDLNFHITQNIINTELCILQCKTNWNDNAQIPMLWDMIYNSSTFRIPYVSVGRNGVNPSSFKQFSYGFVTVPSNQTEYKPQNTSVLRVKGLTGGNYWGKPTVQNIAASLKELPGRRFPTFFNGGVVSHIEASIRSGILNPIHFLSFTWK